MRRIVAVLSISIIIAITCAKNDKDNVKKNKDQIKNVVHHNHKAKRSIYDEDDKPFWANRGKRSANKNSEIDYSDARMIKYALSDDDRMPMLEDNLRQETPFWGNRGRRDFIENDNIQKVVWRGPKEESNGNNIYRKILCGQKTCFNDESVNIRHPHSQEPMFTFKETNEDPPFWGNRGRRSEEDSEESPFWGNRGRRDEDGPFWGARGKRDHDTSSWSETERGDDENPFWGARGRRDEDPPFWGARGRRDQDSPFWGSRGRRNGETEQGAKENVIKSNLINDLKGIKAELPAPKSRQNLSGTSFWQNIGRNSELQYLFNGYNKLKSKQNFNYGAMKSLRQDRLYAEQPSFVVIDRNSRSVSTEQHNDPYVISRGKKVVIPADISKAVRDRRNIIKEMKQSSQNDPFFPMRGKKNEHGSRHEQLNKAKDLICSAVSLMNSKDRNKRDMNDRDRNRRYILKKLAAQLKSDPYFVSRGKKSVDLEVDSDNVEDAMKQINELCNEIGMK